MQSAEIREQFLKFFEERGHTRIPSASLVPENDPTTLFTGSGMQPLLPYLLGQRHPQGTRLVNSQKCFRSQDIEEVGDNRHTTFFEMLGNWSLGDYWKKEQLSWFLEFLMEVGIKKERLWVTCFEGDEKLGLPKDMESADIWKKLGIPEERIKFYSSKKNWWSRSGVPADMPAGEPGGPDSEVFYEFTQVEHDPKFGAECHPNCDCGRFMEIGNSVFMEYVKQADGSFKPLPQRNVDFGGGLERVSTASNDGSDLFGIDVFKTAIKNLEVYSSKKYDGLSNKRSYRIVVDHIRAAVFLMADGTIPSNTDRGYFVRRLLRRAVLHLDKLEVEGNQLHNPLDSIVNSYKTIYPNLLHRKREIEDALNHEEQQFRKTLTKGLIEFDKLSGPVISGSGTFSVSATYGLPIDLMTDLAKERGLKIDFEGFEVERRKHQDVSRAGSEQKFKGGLADHSEMSVKYHTATHLLHQALRDVLGESVYQKGSNITPERLRLDFSFDRKVTDDEKKRVEDIVNDKIQAALPVFYEDIALEEAKKRGAIGLFEEKYGNKVRVYKVGNYSLEFCGGPHVANTSELGHFTIAKEEAISQGVRRIKAVLK